MQSLFGKTIHLLSNMLDYQAARHKVLVSNIANIGTPAYKSKDLLFEKTLMETMHAGKSVQITKTHNRHLNPELDKGVNYKAITTGEVVNIDKAMTDLAENNLRYNLSAELLLRKFSGLNTVIKDAK
jgi:flagellar basal-body rod protein FlgB